MLPAWKLKPPTSVAEMAAEISHRPVGTDVVGDDDLAVDAVVTKGTRRLFDASRERFCFVEAGYYDRKLWLPLLFVSHGHYFNPEPRLKTESSPRVQNVVQTVDPAS